MTTAQERATKALRHITEGRRIAGCMQWTLKSDVSICSLEKSVTQALESFAAERAREEVRNLTKEYEKVINKITDYGTRAGFTDEYFSEVRKALKLKEKP